MPWFVYAAMATYRGMAGDALLLGVQIIAIMAITMDAVRHEGVFGGVSAGLGFTIGTAVNTLIGPEVTNFLSSLLSGLWGLLNTIWQFFLLGVGIGLGVGAAAFLFGSFLAVIITAIIAVLFNLLLRGASLVQDLIEGVVHSFFVSLPTGYKAILAPFMAAFMVALPLLFLGGLALTLLALFIGFIIGQAIVAFFGGVLSAILSLGVFSFITYFLKPAKHLLETLGDMAALGLWLLGIPGLAPTIWTGAYAMMLHRRSASRGLYLLGLTVILGG